MNVVVTEPLKTRTLGMRFDTRGSVVTRPGSKPYSIASTLTRFASKVEVRCYSGPVTSLALSYDGQFIGAMLVIRAECVVPDVHSPRNASILVLNESRIPWDSWESFTDDERKRELFWHVRELLFNAARHEIEEGIFFDGKQVSNPHAKDDQP